MFNQRCLQSFPLTALTVALMGLMACQSVPEPEIKETETDKATTTSEVSNTPLKLAHSSWVEEHFQTAVVTIGLERLGYQVSKPQEIEYPALYLALANGDLDFSVVSYSGHDVFFQKAGGEEKLVRLGMLTPNGTQGYMIDKKTADQYNITNIQQLQDPAIATLFDADGDGKANLVGCNAGWQCEITIDHHLEEYDLLETVEHDRGQYVPLLADSITRYQQGEPIMFYAYNPHWIGATLVPGEDVIWLEVPYTTLPEGLDVATEADTTVDGINRGFPVVDQAIAVNKDFIEANPIAQKWFELVEIPVVDMNRVSLLINEGENTPEDIERHAQTWVADNQELFDSWLAQVQGQ